MMHGIEIPWEGFATVAINDRMICRLQFTSWLY